MARRASGVPDHLNWPVDSREGQGAGLGLDCVARLARQASPGVDPYCVVRAPPGSADLAFDEERTGPHARRPEQQPAVGPRHEELPLRSVEQEVGIAARQQARGSGGGLGGAISHNLGQDAFMKLLVTQLQHQDPTAPKADSQMLAQLAQFTSLEKLTSIDQSLVALTTLLSSLQKEQA